MIANRLNIICPELVYQIMDTILEVHKELGLGFLESVYEKALIEELSSRKLKKAQLTSYLKTSGYTLDILVNFSKSKNGVSSYCHSLN